MTRLLIVLVLLLLSPFTAFGVPAQPGQIERAWYTPPELLSLLAKRDGIRWALPETLAGRAFVGGEQLTAKAALDDACKQWQLAWFEANGIVVVHKPDDAKLKQWTEAVAGGGTKGAEAAWELGWSRDARSVAPLAKGLASEDPDVALAAARALDLLGREVPVGRDERVDALPAGRVSVLVAAPLPTGTEKLLFSAYPAVRAAALRLLLAHGGKSAEDAKGVTEADRSVLVQLVRQQAFYIPAPAKKDAASKWEMLLPLPKDPAEVKAACDKMIGELPALEKRSGWEEMQHRVRIMAAWSKAGSEPATDALIELTGTKIQFGWFPGFVQKELSGTGSDKALAKLKEIMPKSNRATLVRGLEQGSYGDGLLAYTREQLTEQTVCYVTTRKAGREALDDLLTLAVSGNYAAIDAVGVVGGPKAISVLKTLLHKEEPNSATLAFRAAKALGQVGTLQSAEVLLEASQGDHRFRRHAAVLFLGRIGGPKVETRLREVVAKDADRLVRTAAADALEQIGGGPNLLAAGLFRKTDKALPTFVYRPRNSRFGADFPVNEWVNLKVRIGAFAEFGEMGWNYDAANQLFFRYGGCSGYTNELTIFDLGTEQFVQRRPNEEMAGWEDRRPPRGCSAGRTWDPYCKVGWIGPSIGGTAADLAIAEYYTKDGGYRFCSYDLATDRFRPAQLRQASYGEPAQRYAYDWKNGLMYPVKFQPATFKTKDWWAFDTKVADPYSAEAWLDKTNQEGDYPRAASYLTGAVDQDTGLLVVYLPPFESRPAETWTYNPEKNVWKNMGPKVLPTAQAGAGFSYDPFHKLLLLQSGRKAYQYGGPDDSITWTYDVRSNTWTDLQAKHGPGNPWVGAMDFDPEHNVFVMFNARDKTVWAYRYKQVEPGTTAK